MQDVAPYLPYLYTGMPISLGLGLIAFLLATMLGLGLALLRAEGSRAFRRAVQAYVTIFRGVPELLTILIVYFGSAALLRAIGIRGFELGPFVAAAIAFALQTGSYACQILSDAHGSIPKGLFEAARALGLGRAVTNLKIAVPLMLRAALPALGNLLLVQVKLTAIASAVGVAELTRRAQIVAGATHEPLLAFAASAMGYMVIVFGLTLMQRRIETRGLR